MTSCRFGDTNNAQCGAWKERIWAEERRARCEQGTNTGRSYTHRRRPKCPQGVLGAEGAVACYQGYDGVSLSSTGSLPSTAFTSRTAGSQMHASMEAVASRLAVLETNLQKDKITRRDVQTELRELKDLLRVSSPSKQRQQQQMLLRRLRCAEGSGASGGAASLLDVSCASDVGSRVSTSASSALPRIQQQPSSSCSGGGDGGSSGSSKGVAADAGSAGVRSGSKARSTVAV